MRAVENALAHGVGMDGGHHAVLNFKIIVDDLGGWSQAVGCAGSRRKNFHIFIVEVLVDTHDNSCVHPFAGSGNDDFAGAAGKMGCQTFAVLIFASTFYSNIHTVVFPFPFTHFTTCHGNVTSINNQTVCIVEHFTRIDTIGGVVTKEIGQSIVLCPGVDGYYLDVWVFSHKA